MIDKIELPKATLYKLSEYSLCLIYKSDINFKLQDAIETNDTIYRMMNCKPYTILVDGRGVYGNITNEARNHFVTDPKTKYIRRAEALLIDNLPARIFARFYIKVNKPNNPVKIFGHKEKAMNWLEEIYATNTIQGLTH